MLSLILFLMEPLNGMAALLWEKLIKRQSCSRCPYNFSPNTDLAYYPLRYNAHLIKCYRKYTCFKYLTIKGESLTFIRGKSDKGIVIVISI